MWGNMRFSTKSFATVKQSKERQYTTYCMENQCQAAPFIFRMTEKRGISHSCSVLKKGVLGLTRMRALVVLIEHLPAIIGCIKLLLSYMQFRMSICKLQLNRHNSLCIVKFFLKC
jgi:hypothetical protein